MTDLRKAAEMAYEVMTDIHQVCEGANHKRKDMHPYGSDCPIQKRFDDAWEALRQALAKPVKSYCGGKPNYCTEPEDWVSLYTAKQVAEAVEAAIKSRQWVGLTDEEIADALLPLRNQYVASASTKFKIGKAIEAKLKEKNT